MSSLPKAFALCSLVVVAAACDQTPGGVQQDYVGREREAFVFQVPRATILAQLDRMLADEGLAIASSDGDTLHTTARPYVADDTLELSIHLIALRGGGTEVQIVDIVRDAKGTITDNHDDTSRVWTLATRADPDRAEAILREGNARADEVAPRAKRREHDHDHAPPSP